MGLRIHHKSRIPYLFHSFSDFVIYVVTTLIFPKNQRQCASFSINVAILFLSFKRAIIVPNKLIAFHSLSHFTLTTTQLNLSFLKTLNYSKTIQRLVLSFRNLHYFPSYVTKTQTTFWLEVNFIPMTNLELSNALAYDAKLVLSLIT